MAANTQARRRGAKRGGGGAVTGAYLGMHKSSAQRGSGVDFLFPGASVGTGDRIILWGLAWNNDGFNPSISAEVGGVAMAQLAKVTSGANGCAIFGLQTDTLGAAEDLTVDFVGGGSTYGLVSGVWEIKNYAPGEDVTPYDILQVSSHSGALDGVENGVAIAVCGGSWSVPSVSWTFPPTERYEENSGNFTEGTGADGLFSTTGTETVLKSGGNALLCAASYS